MEFMHSHAHSLFMCCVEPSAWKLRLQNDLMMVMHCACGGRRVKPRVKPRAAPGMFLSAR